MGKISFFALFFIIISKLSASQCTTTINSFPYNENFEASNGNWISGGVNSDWAWGNPSKPYITNAGSGTKCWVTGGLNGSSYANAERSYIESPCFDFTNLQYPHIKFKIFWESEYTYDGTTFQYSLNNGATWVNLGTPTDPVDCLNDNWFNTNSINYLTTLANPKNGWSGSTNNACGSSNGSGGWVLAQHCMSNLAGVPNVKFRFAFGAGTSCNAFDGVGIDDITIGEAPANNANFTSACTNNVLEYLFTNTSALCPSTFSWNFGDAASGVNNTSTLQNPTHQFSTSGTYSVTLTVTGPCNAPSTITKTIITLGNALTSTFPTCNNSNNGSITTTITNGTSPINYSLLPNNVTNNTGVFNSLSGGTYTISATDAIGCSITTSVTLTAPNAINLALTPDNISCNGLSDGEILAAATGGMGTINFTLNPGNTASSTGNYTNLAANTYTIIATDANNCTQSSSISLTQPQALTFSTVNFTNLNCNGDHSGSITAATSGGTGLINYTLYPTIFSNSTGIFNNLNAGSYTLTATDANGCGATTTIAISQPPKINITSLEIKNPGCNPNNDGSIKVNANGGNGVLEYSYGGSYSSNNLFNSLTPNSYTVTVKDANGCTESSVALLLSSNAPSFTTTNSINPTCYNSNDGSINVNANNGTVAITGYVLAPGGTNNTTGSFTNLSSGIYTVTVIDANLCSNTTTLSIASPTQINIDYTNYYLDSCGASNNARVETKATGGTGVLNYTIEPGNFSNNSGTFYGLASGNYQITVKDGNGCYITSTITIQEKTCCDKIFVPTAFSPNNDGRNDELPLLNKSGNELDEFIIVNRWGNVVFKAQHIDDSWDGKYKSVDAEIGTYFYLLKYKCSSTGKNYLYKGDILLIR